MLQAQQVLDYLIGITNGEREKKVSLAASGLDYLFPVAKVKKQ